MKSKLFLSFGLTNGFNMSAYKRFVNESQYWSPEQIEKYQMEMLTPLLQHALIMSPTIADYLILLTSSLLILGKLQTFIYCLLFRKRILCKIT